MTALNFYNIQTIHNEIHKLCRDLSPNCRSLRNFLRPKLFKMLEQYFIQETGKKLGGAGTTHERWKIFSAFFRVECFMKSYALCKCGCEGDDKRFSRFKESHARQQTRFSIPVHSVECKSTR